MVSDAPSKVCITYTALIKVAALSKREPPDGCYSECSDFEYSIQKQVSHKVKNRLLKLLDKTFHEETIS